MCDPVTLGQSGTTYDREFLSEWLLGNPTICPLGVDYGEKLQYSDNVNIRQLLTLYLGDDAYQKYDDSSFKRQYSARLVEHDASTMFNLGCLQAKAPIQNFLRASHYFELATEWGHAGAQCSLGSFHRNGGHGVEQDYKKARKCYERAANQGIVPAQYAIRPWCILHHRVWSRKRS